MSKFTTLGKVYYCILAGFLWAVAWVLRSSCLQYISSYLVVRNGILASMSHEWLTSYHDFIVLTLQPRRPWGFPAWRASREHRQWKQELYLVASSFCLPVLCSWKMSAALLFLLPVCCRTFLKYRQAEWIKKWSLSMSWSHRDSFLDTF